MSYINNTYATYPDYITKQKEIIIGTLEPLNIKQESSDNLLDVSGMIVGRKIHDESHTAETKEISREPGLQHYPWTNLTYDKAYTE